MQVVKWQDGLAVALTPELVEKFQLQAGDEVGLEIGPDRILRVTLKPSREEALAQIRAAQWPVPSDWKWNREDANARR